MTAMCGRFFDAPYINASIASKTGSRKESTAKKITAAIKTVITGSASASIRAAYCADLR